MEGPGAQAPNRLMRRAAGERTIDNSPQKGRLSFCVLERGTSVELGGSCQQLPAMGISGKREEGGRGRKKEKKEIKPLSLVFERKQWASFISSLRMVCGGQDICAPKSVV